MDIVLIPPELQETFAEVLLEYCPRWHACAVGPELGFGAGRPMVRVEFVSGADEAEAESEFWQRVEAACEDGGTEFDPSDWEMAHPMRILGGS